MDNIKSAILTQNTCLGIELGSTRIKAILINKNHTTLASGSFNWENQLENGIWTYSLSDVWKGLQSCFLSLKTDVKNKYGVELTSVGSIGISAMMHGYLVFDKNDKQLVPFRTWRNTITGDASSLLTKLFQYNIPQRWSIAHLYQAILNNEAHTSQIAYMTTLAGYIHWKLTGKKVLGIGDASGMFPIDITSSNYNQRMLSQFDNCIKEKHFSWKLSEILPQVLLAGECAGHLTEEGAKLLDPSGSLLPNIPFCPPEGDAGTGMVATNSVKKQTGNISVGTSLFSMIVLEKELTNVYPEIDLVTTPDGSLVAMVHCNNGVSELGSWVSLFIEFAETLGITNANDKIYDILFNKALEGAPDGGGLLSYNYLSGEHLTGFEEGRPLFVRTPDSHFNLANFMRVHLMTSFGALQTGLNILFSKEQVKVNEIYGHGGLFKTKEVGQKIMASAINVPVSTIETAGEGGAWGVALLASYMKNKEDDETLGSYLEDKVFYKQKKYQVVPNPIDIEGFNHFMKYYSACLTIERAAIEALQC